MALIRIKAALPSRFDCGSLPPYAGCAVRHRWTIRHLFGALAWLGLVLAPVAMPVAAMAAPLKMTAMDIAAMDMATVHAAPVDMPEGMPCCPETGKQPGGAKDCPFLALCTGILFPPLASGAALPFPLLHLAAVAPRNDTWRSGLAHGPPARPPKA